MAGSVVGNKSAVLVAFANSPLLLGVGTSGADDSAEDSLYDRFLNMAGTRYALLGRWAAVFDGVIETLNQISRLDRQAAECGRAAYVVGPGCFGRVECRPE